MGTAGAAVAGIGVPAGVGRADVGAAGDAAEAEDGAYVCVFLDFFDELSEPPEEEGVLDFEVLLRVLTVPPRGGRESVSLSELEPPPPTGG